MRFELTEESPLDGFKSIAEFKGLRGFRLISFPHLAISHSLVPRAPGAMHKLREMISDPSMAFHAPLSVVVSLLVY